MKRKRLIVLFALSLAACGGSGTKESTAPEPAPESTENEESGMSEADMNTCINLCIDAKQEAGDEGGVAELEPVCREQCGGGSEDADTDDEE